MLNLFLLCPCSLLCQRVISSLNVHFVLVQFYICHCFCFSCVYNLSSSSLFNPFWPFFSLSHNRRTQAAGNVMEQDSAAAVGACSTVNRYLTAGAPTVALWVAAGIFGRMSSGVRRTVMEQCVVQCVAQLTIAAKNGDHAFDDCDALGLINEVKASLPSELEHDHTNEILAMLADGSRCRSMLKSRCIASAAAQPENMIHILWNECRQPLVSLYR